MRRTYLLPTFIICFIIAVGIFFLMRSSSFDVLHLLVSPIQKQLFVIKKNNSSDLDRVRGENKQLRAQLAQMQLVERENQALRDQFPAEQDHASRDIIPISQLLPASIVSMPDFFPGIGQPSMCVIDKGSKAKTYIGQPVIIKNILIGTVVKTTNNFSQVRFILSPETSMSVRTSLTNAIGVMKGKGDHMVLESVLLSDSLSVGDTVATVGNVDINGMGIPSGLIIGTIFSVEKDPSALFQKANIKPLVDIKKLSTVFLITR